jgi:hypothetical protein
MDFDDKIKAFTNHIVEIKSSIHTEEATKTSVIMPFFQLLGYDVFNPNEFTPEYIADVGIKKGEKVDYAIILNDELVMLVEAKAINENLEKYDSQLFRYFGTTKAKFAILTNGLIYRFYTDLEKQNVMDATPFMEIDLENLSDNDIQSLKKFQKENFNINNIFSTASELKYISMMKKALKDEFSNPSDDFVKLIISKKIYSGVKTATIIEKYRLLLQKVINSYLNELTNARLQSAMQSDKDDNVNNEEVDNKNNIVTTVEEIQSFYIVKSILSEYCNPSDISYKDTCYYFNILYDNKVTKWICRVVIRESVRYVIIPDVNKKEKRYELNNMNDIYKLKSELKARLNQLKSYSSTKEIDVL